uniref:ANK_REP_REGION domain-containing protein n=1 Tax=Hydatigena taeniaeformis TaxID=6205 RepID=A0A0R3WW69_HYDTA
LVCAFQSKRTALHYAAQTNVESVITLLTYNKGLLKCVDSVSLDSPNPSPSMPAGMRIIPEVKADSAITIHPPLMLAFLPFIHEPSASDDLTPLQFIQHEHRQSMYHFLEFHTELYSAGEEGGLTSNGGNKKAIHLRRLIEAPLILDSYVCTFLPLRRESICEKCNTRGYNHEKLAENADFMKVIASRELGCVRRPTNAFGQFEKTFSPIVSQVSHSSTFRGACFLSSDVFGK